VKEGLSVEHAAIETWKSHKKYSVITMCDVLEHVENPLEVLKKCRELLIPGGVIYIQVPTVLGLRYPYKDSLGLPHHLWQFSPKHLLGVVKNAGFKNQRYWTGVQGVIRHYENGGPTLLTHGLWKLAMATKRGNRLQVLAVNA
jgi:predicted SAM-dependent methyltransferase